MMSLAPCFTRMVNVPFAWHHRRHRAGAVKPASRRAGGGRKRRHRGGFRRLRRAVCHQSRRAETGAGLRHLRRNARFTMVRRDLDRPATAYRPRVQCVAGPQPDRHLDAHRRLPHRPARGAAMGQRAQNRPLASRMDQACV